MTATLLERARKEGTPLVDGEQATFVWEGSDPPLLVGDFTNWTEKPIQLQEEESGVWTTSVILPREAYVEYAFLYRFREDDEDTDIDERIVDPFNLRMQYNGMNAMNNTFTMPDYAPSPLTRRGAGVKRGKISQHQIANDMLGGRHRLLSLYHPPVEEPVPLVVVWDGPDYLNRANLNIIVDNLIAQGRIRPIALAMIQNAHEGRFTEYVQNEATVGFAMYELLPYARKHLQLVDEKEHPGCHGVLGASMGGLMALYTGLRAPHVFGHVVSQSGAFHIAPNDDPMLIDELVRLLPRPPLRIWQDVGQIEWLLDGNRRMHAQLTERGYDVTYLEYSGGHNFPMWAQVVGQALKAVYPPEA
ncbi:MAG: esterase family protein [Chloroflexi bacterium]|nr:esterase family protein [Chloroflexota bacterium]